MSQAICEGGGLQHLFLYTKIFFLVYNFKIKRMTLWQPIIPLVFKIASKMASLSSNQPLYQNTYFAEVSLALKIENFQLKIFDIFLILAQNIDCGYTLEPPCRGGSNEYPQSMFLSKNKKNRYTPANPSFTV